MSFKAIRITLLLLVLAGVAMDQFFDLLNATDWEDELWVGVYPVNADGSQRSARYIAALDEDDFAPIAAWIATQGQGRGITAASPLRVRLGDPVSEKPPLPSPSHGLLQRILWQFELRRWAGKHDTLPNGLRPDIRLFLLYYDPQSSPALPHSLGLQKGFVGIVHAFADRRLRGSNQVVITHELLHTLGASDKYDLASGQPSWPDGYAEPYLEPRYPQRKAEIMGGRIPQDATQAVIPESLESVMLGRSTASEIGWD